MPRIEAELTVTQTPVVDGVRTIDGIIANAELGIFYDSALLGDYVMRDDRCASVMMTRVLGLLGVPLKMEPPKDNARHRKIAEEIEYEWESIFSDAELFELVTWGLFHGTGLGQLCDPWPRLEAWHPSALWEDQQQNAYFVSTKRQSNVKVDPGNRRWVMYAPYGDKRPMRKALLRSLARPVLYRQWVLRDWARYSEKHGMPLTVAVAPGGASPADLRTLETDLMRMGAEGVFVVRQGEAGNQYDIKLVEAVANSHEGFARQIEIVNQMIAVRVLGQSMSTDGQAGLGSNDQAGEPTFLKLLRADAKYFARWAREQVLKPYCEVTYGDPEVAPYPCPQVEPPEDKAKRATELKLFFEAMQIAPPEVDRRALIEAAGIDMISEAEQAALEAEKALEAAAIANQSQEAEAEDPADADQPEEIAAN
jgi:phage gp29-like protein